MANSLPDTIHDIFQDNDDNDKRASQLLKRRLYYSIHRVKLNKAAKLRRDKKSQEKSLLKSCSLPNKVVEASAAKTLSPILATSTRSKK